jgi:phosphohistidine swiveling domain-containing protein
MYDQTQFTPLWLIGDGGVYAGKDPYFLMKKLSGYTPVSWYTYTQKVPTAFFFGAYDLDALAKEAAAGFSYFSKLKTALYFEKVISKSLVRITALRKKFTAIYGDESLILKTRPVVMHDFLKETYDVVSPLMGHYLLTQPQRFYRFEEVLKNDLADPALSFVASNGHRLTLVSQIFKALSRRDYDSVDRLGFLTWGYLGGDVTDRTSSINRVEEKRKIKELELIIRRRRNFLQKNSSKSFRLADVMGRAAVWRFDMQALCLATLKWVDVINNAGAKHFGIAKADLDTYTYPELLKLYKTGTRVPIKELRIRQTGSLMRYRGTKIDLLYGEKARHLIRDLLAFRIREIEETKNLNGVVASRPQKSENVLVGECFVLSSAYNAERLNNQFKNGQVLIATQTHPNVITMMRRASAIVTDEGGITCHAAIVSRELGKPCIIGTRLATKIFKTGDRIELNFGTGGVRKL